MKKILLLLFFFACLNATVHAQTAKYTMHTIAQGETLSMLATKYRTTVGDIMRLNGMHAQSRLVIGEKIKIPSDGKAVAPVVVEKTAPAPVVENTGTLTHTVQQGETLYAISKKYGVTVEQIKQWNKLQTPDLEVGQQLAVNSKGVSAVTAAKKSAAQKKTEEIKQQVPVVVEETEEKIISADSLAKADAAKTKESKVVIVAANTKPVTTAAKPVTTGVVKDGSDSFFAVDFLSEGSKKTKTISGDAMTFKTASGWLDKKYYVLMNGAPAGTLVKITAENGNSIYAKVLWKLDDMKLNQGLTFRVNDAAAAALNIAYNKFALNIDYHE